MGDAASVSLVPDLPSRNMLGQGGAWSGGADLELLARWVELMIANGREPATIHQHAYGVFRLLEFHRFRVHLWDMESDQIAAFLASLGTRSAAKHHYMKGVRSFYHWAVARGYLLADPTTLIDPKRSRPKPPEAFTQDDLIRLVLAAAWRDPKRAWAIIACYSLGCRRGEFVNIRLKDIDWERERVYLSVTKGNKPRYVPMNDLAREALDELAVLAEGDLLLPVAPNTMSSWVHQAGIDCGFDGRKLRAHTLRATFITDLANAGARVHVIADLVGHESIATTTAYLAVTDPQRAEAASLIGGRHEEAADPARDPRRGFGSGHHRAAG